MLKQILSTRFPLLILHPALVFHREYFSAIADAGGLPVFDTEFFSDDEVLEKTAILEKESFTFGLRLSVSRKSLLAAVTEKHHDNLELLVFHYESAGQLEDFSFTSHDCRFFIETLDIGLNKELERIAPHGLILRGYEAPGRVSGYTSFILMQWYLENSDLPLFIHGGVGPYTAAGLLAAGVSGFVLDNQLYLCDEAPLSEPFKKLISEITENDTVVVGESRSAKYRFFAKLGTKIVKTLKEKESLAESGPDGDQSILADIVASFTAMDRQDANPLQSLFYLGQDASFARSFIARAQGGSRRLADVIKGFFSSISRSLGAVDDHDPLVENSPLAEEHGTRYPVIQGPMANISDNPAFAEAIYANGGLPFFAMGNLPADLSETMISQGKKRVPRFGAGLIGIETFNRTIHQHFDLVKRYKVPFALFAGGVPSQVNELEQAGTKTYLHTPNMMMLKNAIDGGCTRFIFEGTEAGGHVGSLTSLVLWESAMDILMAQEPSAVQKQCVIFAGGISTTHASAFISGLSAVLAGHGAKIGIQVGTAYLFTREIVALKSIGNLYQNTLTRSRKTIVTGNTVGLASRTVPTPFALKLVENEHRRIQQGMGLTERKTVFETENLGSLLISAKGFLPDIHGQRQGELTYFSEEEQYEKGNFLVGESLAFLNPGISIQDIHNRYFHEKNVLFSNVNQVEKTTSPQGQINDDIAVIGVGCVLPGASDTDTLWNNILSGACSIRTMPEDRLNSELYWDTNKQAEDKSYTRVAGLVSDFHFNHELFGFTKTQADTMSRSQKMLLTALRQAVLDAGYADTDQPIRPGVTGRTAVIVASCLGNERSNDLQLKYYYPEILSCLEKIQGFQELPESGKDGIRAALKLGMSGGDPGTDSFEDITLHMEAARMARYIGSSGTAYVVDAACATSFAALDCAMGELLSGRHDTAVVAGINTNLSPEAFIGFGKMGALSARGSWPFDQRADGFVLGEGTAVFLLKRLKDAVRDKNHIHGIIKGVGSSSDGKGKAIAAPNPAGQRLALTRCYEKIKSPVSVSDIAYIEAHGTSTIMGDQAEIETLKSVYQGPNPIGVSSIKSQIGHLLGGAGAAGLLKALLAIRYQTLPPNGQFGSLSENIDLTESPLYIITEPRPWTTAPGQTRKAAVSSYGFGGINYHVVIEEYAASSPLLPRMIFKDLDSDPNDRRIVFAGLGVVLPGAKNSGDFSQKFPGEPLKSVPMPADRFDMARYAEEPDPVFRLPLIPAGIVDDFKFNNVKYRIPPMAARSVERAQLFALDAASQAFDNSGLASRLVQGNKTGVIVGTVSGRQHAENILRVRVPYLAQIIRNVPGLEDSAKQAIGSDLASLVRSRYPKNTEDTVPGFLSNIVSGRIANFFGCNGANFIVDASDASSAIAMDIAAQHLRSGDMDFALAGGVDANLYPFVMFTARDAGLFNDACYPGAMGEGAALLVMTRLGTAKKQNLPVLGEYLDGVFSFDPSGHGTGPDEKIEGSNKTQCLRNSGVSKIQIRSEANPSWDFGYLRSAGTAVKMAEALIRKGEKTLNYTGVSSRASGGLSGYQLTGSVHPRLTGKKQAPARHERFTEKKPAATKQRVVALLSGQGAQHPGMMKELYDGEPEIKAVMDRGERLFQSARGTSLLDLMFGHDEALNLTENTQPAVFLSTAAIYDYLKTRGFAPDHVIGHSVGEFSALYCMGVLGFDEAMKLVITRADLMKDAALAVPGKIMVVFDSADKTLDLIRESGQTVYVANKNSDKQTAVSGAAAAIEAFCSFLSDKGRTFTRLSLSGAFHTPLFENAAEKLGQYMEKLRFNTDNAGRIISNVLAQPYPDHEESIRKLLIRQITSPVEFIRSVKSVYQPGQTRFIEIGPNRLLSNLLKNMGLDDVQECASVNTKKGQGDSFKAFVNELIQLSLISRTAGTAPAPGQEHRRNPDDEKEFDMNFNEDGEDDFSSFVLNNEERLKKMLYNEYMSHKKQAAFEAFEKFQFNPGKIVVSGVAVGLPGTAKDVFDPENFTRLLAGTNFIEPLPASSKEKMVDKNVTKLQKDPDGNARFVEITSTDDVIQLAGQLGYFDLDKQYGIKKQYDTTIALAMAAGIEALKDAHIPLVMQYKKTSTGSIIQDGYALPREMQKNTGVILSALWPYSETLIREMTHYFYNKFYVKPYEELEKIYYHLMESVTDSLVKDQVTDWFFKIKERRKIYGDYKLTRDFAHNLTPLGSAHFAQYIRAKGPNIQMSGACASTTQAIGIAEDWIRTGRCDRVIIIGGETPTSDAQSPWICSGFLSLGAASVKKNVADAAKPFDANRNGTILGSGAVSLILEREEPVLRRGMKGQVEVLGTHIGNTAYHTYNIDIKGISSEMKRFVGKVEKRHNLKKEEYSKNLVFMSHETFTPARGGSADAEITALRTTYPDTYKEILISNTKGYTGHTLGAALEDAALVKVLQTGIAPPIANLKDISDDFKDLRLAKTAVHGDFQFGFHIAAGFGSHLAFAFFKRIEENKTENNPRYLTWLKAVTGSSAPQLREFNNTLMAEAGGQKISLADPARSSDLPETPKTALTLDKPEELEKKTAAEPLTTIIPDIVDVAVVSGADKALIPESLISTVRQTIAAQTGYTEDMLDEDLDLEADLGIDTVKQVEIFGKISAQYNLKVPENLKLKDLNTIKKLVAYMDTRVAPEPARTPAPAPDDVKTAAPVMAPAESSARPALVSDIKNVIAAQTGYDVDMLDDNLDLEADLGIDTVKQVEIFGKISAQYNLKVPENLKLKDLNTIKKLVAYMEGKIGPVQQTLPTVPSEHAPAESDAQLSVSGVKRHTLSVRKAIGSHVTKNPFDKACILVTQDSHGFADAVCREIRKKGGSVITLGRQNSSDIQADLSNPAATADILSRHMSLSSIKGLIHLAPLDYYLNSPKTFDFFSKKASLDEVINLSVKSFFVLVKELKHVLDRQGAIIAAMTFNSVVFPYMEGFNGVIHPAFAGMAGLMKTVNKEYPDTLVRLVDFADDKPKNRVADLAKTFIDELCTDERRVETGYMGGTAYVLAMAETPLVKDKAMISKGDSILVTGGALGITFEILRKTAETYGADLVILGRSRISDLDSHYLLPGMDEKQILARVKSEMNNSKPLDIKRAADKIIRTREAVLNIKRLEALGIKVHYESVDVTNYAAVEQVVKKHRNISGVIHAAGLEESQFIEKKDLSSFNRVMDVKVKGLDHLLKAMKDRTYRFFITFSSVTARFGNEGQSDYTAANDMIGKMLMKEKKQHPERCYKVYAWTAWSGAGMAENDTVKKVLQSRGITFLPLNEGINFFLRDLENTKDTEVVITGADTVADTDVLLDSAEVPPLQGLGQDYPFLDIRQAHSDNHARYLRTLDLQRDLFLFDHSMEDTPIFLGATGIETMAEAAAHLRNHKTQVLEIRDFSIPYGIKILKGRPKEIIVEAETAGPSMEQAFACRISSVFTSPKGQVMGDPTLHYQGLFILGDSPAQDRTVALPPFKKPSYRGTAESLIYHPQRLFMEDIFKTLKDVLSFDGDLLVTEFCDTSPKDFFKGVGQPSFFTDVVAVDALFQTGGLLEFFTSNNLVLPYKIRRMFIFKRVTKGAVYYCMTRKTAEDAETCTFQLQLVDPSGILYIQIDDFCMVKLSKLEEAYRITDRL